MTDEPNYDSKTMQSKMGDDPIASPTKDQITGNTVMQKIRSLIDNYLGWSKEITDKVNSLEPGGSGGKTYTAGDGIAISEDVISNTDHTQTQTNTSDIASIRVSMSDMASSAALGAETEARKSADATLQTNIDKKQDKLSTAQQSALDSGITATKVQKYDAYDSIKQNTLNTTQMNAVNSGIDTAKVTKYDGYGTKITTLEGDISQLKISDAKHTTTLADQAKQLSSQATEITALQTKTANHDTEIQGLSESVVSDLTGSFTDSTRTLKLSLERESAPSIDCSVVIPAGGSGTAGVSSFNGKTGAVTQTVDVLGDPIGSESGMTIPFTRYTSQVETHKSIVLPNVTDEYAGIVTVEQKQDWDAKADASTVTQIQTAVGGCFNDASISGNMLNLSTVGGQTNSLTLPGGSGGSLPSDGYYWEKVTKWPNDWVSSDIVMFRPNYYQLSNNATWNSNITYEKPKETFDLPYIVLKLIQSSTSRIPYYIYPSAGAITINGAKMSTLFNNWNNGSSTNLIGLEFIAFNGNQSNYHSIYQMKGSDLITYGLYRLRKFS